MNTVEITVVIVLLIAVLIFLKKRKKCSACSSKETLADKPKAPKQENQHPEVKLESNPLVSAIPTAVNGQITDAVTEQQPASDVEANAFPTAINDQITDTAIASASLEPQPANKPTGVSELPAKPEAVSLPEDSILKRHYMTHLCTMIESIVPPRPTESVLCRHYDAMVVTRIGRCLNDKKAMEQLIHDYENKK